MNIPVQTQYPQELAMTVLWWDYKIYWKYIQGTNSSSLRRIPVLSQNQHLQGIISKLYALRVKFNLSFLPVFSMRSATQRSHFSPSSSSLAVAAEKRLKLVSMVSVLINSHVSSTNAKCIYGKLTSPFRADLLNLWALLLLNQVRK